MAKIIKKISNMRPLMGRISRPVLAIVLAAVVMAASGCTTIQTFAVKEAFPLSGRAATKGPDVTVLPVQETLEDSPAAAAFAADPTYLGKGMRGMGMILLLPYFSESDEFHADASRIDTIGSAALSRLNDQGIPAVYQPRGGVEQINALPQDHLALALTLRKLRVDTEFNGLLPFIMFNAFMFTDTGAHVVLDCQLLQPGVAAPLWQGTVEGRHSAGRDIGVAGVAVSKAIDQCISKSGLQETRAHLASQRYAQLMAIGRDEEKSGDGSRALELYGQAYVSAMTADQSAAAIAAMALVIPKLPGKPPILEGARKLKVQAEVAVREKRFKDAADLYGASLNVAPWWPEGHFNLALVLGETENYNVAVREMDFYLQLAPNAPNARAAQDKIYEWEGKVR